MVVEGYKVFNSDWIWHCCLTGKQKEAVLSLPNFDAGIFKEITGIDVDMEVQDVWNLI